MLWGIVKSMIESIGIRGVQLGDFWRADRSNNLPILILVSVLSGHSNGERFEFSRNRDVLRFLDLGVDRAFGVGGLREDVVNFVDV